MLVDRSLMDRAAIEANIGNDYQLQASSAPIDPVINSIGLALLAEMNSGNEQGRLYVDSLANILALHLVRRYSSCQSIHEPRSGGLSGRRLRLVLECMGSNYGRDLSLSDLAGVAGMSTFHFAREFKRATNSTPHQYLMKLRVDRAKELLSKSEMPLVEVGHEAGFSHQSHFTRLFRRLTGTTPQSYRLMYQT